MDDGALLGIAGHSSAPHRVSHVLLKLHANALCCACPPPAPQRCAEKAREEFFERSRYDRERLAGHPLTFQVEEPGAEPSGGACVACRVVGQPPAWVIEFY